MSKPIQYILVDKRIDCHEYIVYSVARASFLCWYSSKEEPSWKSWVSGPFTKIVRRGSSEKIAKALEEQEQYRYNITAADTQGFTAFEPMTKEDMGVAMAQLQVADFNKARVGWDEAWKDDHPTTLDIYPPIVYVNEGLGMSTGKTAAQVAHGIMAWAFRQDEKAQAKFFQQPWFKIVGLKSNEFEDYLKEDVSYDRVVIHDAGHTEVDPNTATVSVIGTW